MTTTLVGAKEPTSTADVAVDAWFNPTPELTGQMSLELMIWVGHHGPIQPIGSKVAEVNVDGVDYDLWYGDIGWKVCSYVAKAQQLTLTFKPADFFHDMVNRGYAEESMFCTSIQFGSEIWSNGVGFEVTKFKVETYAVVGHDYGMRPEGAQ